MAEIKLDPVRYEIFFNKLDQALNEAQDVVRVLSGSTIVREAGEALEAFYLPSGEAVDIAAGILMHFLNITRVIKYMKENRYDAPGIGIYDGDQFMNNEAYIGGMHAPDTGLIAPFFYKGELLGYMAAISHTTETGGVEPGGMCPSAREAWHDGFHVPAVKIVERGVTRRDVWNMLLRSTRDPRTLELDLRARIAGNERARSRLTELVEEFGVDFFKAATKQIVKDGEDFFRAKLKKIRPGIYSSRVYCDTLGGPQPPKLSVIQVDIEITDDGVLILRIPVISPQQDCYNNAYIPAVEATLVYCLLTQVVYETRWNSGLANAIKIEVPDKSRLNADETQSVGYATVGIGVTFAAGITEALSRAYYASGIEEEVQAPPTGGFIGPMHAGIDQSGRFFAQFYMSSTFGGGASVKEDGMSNYHFYNPWQYVEDFESEEMLTSGLLLFSNCLVDSGGFGKYRAGSPTSQVWAVHKGIQSFPSAIGIGTKIAPNQGIYGGYPSNIAYNDEITNTNLYELIKEGKPLPQEPSDLIDISRKVGGKVTRWGASMPAVPMKSGDIFITIGNTGGGFGDPIERDTNLIAEDIRNKRVSIDVCQKVYAVSINPSTLEVNLEETERRREERKKERLSQGIPAGEFIKFLIERRKKRELSSPALEFLDETLNFSPAFKEQIETEERLAGKELKPLKEAKVKQLLFKLTPYVNIGEDEQCVKIALCSRCGFAYCDAAEDHKLYSLVYERDPKDYLPEHLAPDKDWGVYREFYCPGCGVQTEMDQTPPGMPIIPNARIKGINSL